MPDLHEIICSMQGSVPSIVIIVPVRNEAAHIRPLLRCLESVREQVLLVNGESVDQTVSVCEQAGFEVIDSAPGRARQMNNGVRHVKADCYWFLHADCLPPNDAVEQIIKSCQQGYAWGRFNVRLMGDAFIFRVIEKMMNWRSCLTQVATGDQGIFVSKALFEEIGGFPEIPLMEDIAISKLLRRHSRGVCLQAELNVSSRRWQAQGITRTILLMWWLRLRYVMGADPADLHRVYYG